jgi:hypothetical protein
MIGTEGTLARGEDSAMLLGSIGMTALVVERDGEIVPSRERVGMIRAEDTLTYLKDGTVLFFRLGMTTLIIEGEGEIRA